MATSETTRGQLGPGEFAGLLLGLARRRATGRLEVVADGEPRHIYLESGIVRSVFSEAEDEKLGSWLVAQGELEPAAMAVALLRQPDGVRFGAFLVEQGLIGQERLAKALEGLTVAIVSRLLVPGGAYTLVEGERPPGDTATIEMTPASALVAAARRAEDIAGLEALIPKDRYPTAVASAESHHEGVQLQPQEAFLLSRIDGGMTVDQLRRVMPLPREATSRCLAVLAISGLISLSREPGSVPQAVAEPREQAVAGREAEVLLTPEQRREFEEIARLANECRLKDHYRRLGLSQGATLDQIHERYREFVRTYSPERAREPHLRSLRRELAEINDAITEAYETLSNPEKRTHYLEGLKLHPSQTPEQKADDDRRLRARRELARANVQRAQALVRAGDFGAAALLLDEAVRAEPNAETLLLLARVEQRNPMWANRALQHLRLATALDPQFTEAWLELAAFWGRKRQKARQVQCIESILAYDPINAEALRMLAASRDSK